MHKKAEKNINVPFSIFNKDFIEQIFKNSHEAIIAFSRDNELIFISNNSLKILGVSEDDIRKNWFYSILIILKLIFANNANDAINSDLSAILSSMPKVATLQFARKVKETIPHLILDSLKNIRLSLALESPPPCEPISCPQVIIDEVIFPDYIVIKVIEDVKSVRFFGININSISNGKFTIFNIRDITEYKISSETEIEKEHILHAILTATPIGLGMIRDDKLVWSNEALMRILGINSSERIQSLSDLKFNIVSEKISQRNLFQILSEFDFGEISIQLQKSEGRVAECLLLSCPVDINDPSRGKVFALADISEQKRFEVEGKKSQEQFRQLALHIENIREQEKKRISFEIHDELGYALTALKLDLAWLKNKKGNFSPETAERFKSMTELIDSTIRKIRTICTELRPSILDHFGLAAALEWQLKEFQKRTGIITELYLEDDNAMLREKYSVMIFRILQEALTNIARHSHANKVNTSFILKNNLLELTIKDNGIGIQLNDSANIETYGLISMRERANSIGGNLEIIGKKGKGTTVKLKVKIPEKEIHRD